MFTPLALSAHEELDHFVDDDHARGDQDGGQSLLAGQGGCTKDPLQEAHISRQEEEQQRRAI
jgi:hypothetical protein